MYMFLYSVIILKTPSFIVLPHIFNSYDSLIKQYTPNHVDFNTFFRTTHEIHIKILQIEEPSLLYPKKTKNPNPSPIGNRFGFFLFGGRGWIRTTEAEKQQIYSLSPLATREHAHILFAVIADCLYILSSEVAFVNYFFHGFSLFLSFSIFLRFTAIKALPITVKDPKTFSVLRSLWSW